MRVKIRNTVLESQKDPLLFVFMTVMEQRTWAHTCWILASATGNLIPEALWQLPTVPMPQLWNSREIRAS